MTVTIPSYNYARYLEESALSAATQGGVDVDVDVVIVENASTDSSPEIARALAAEHDNIRVVEHDSNHGIISSLNRCRDEIRGEYAVLLCADDCLTPGSLRRSVEFLEAHRRVGLTYGPVIDFERLDALTDQQLVKRPRAPRLYEGDEWILRRCRAPHNPIRTPEVVVRSSVLEKAGRLDPACPHTSDLNMWLRVAVRSDVAFLPGLPLALFRRHGGNHSNAYMDSPLLGIEQKWNAYSLFFESVPDHPQRRSWESEARRAIAREARYAASRVFVKDSSPTPELDAQKLLDLAAVLDPSKPVSDSLAWRVRRTLGPKGARAFPLFLPRLVLGRIERVAAESRRTRVGG